MQRLDAHRLEHIIEYCDEIMGTINRYGDDYKIFECDRDYQKSISFSILQIGELCAGLSDEFKMATEKQIPWTSIKGMRNIVVHNYGNVDKNMVWESAKTDVPELKKFCENELK